MQKLHFRGNRRPKTPEGESARDTKKDGRSHRKVGTDGKEHHAKDYFYNSMTKSQRVFFANNYTDEMARLQAWARANEEEIIYQSGDWIVNQFAMPNTSITEENDIPSLIIMIAVGASSLLCLGLIILKKNRSN